MSEFNEKPVALKAAMRKLSDAVIIAHQEAEAAGWELLAEQLRVTRSIVSDGFQQVCFMCRKSK